MKLDTRLKTIILEFLLFSAIVTVCQIIGFVIIKILHICCNEYSIVSYIILGIFSSAVITLLRLILFKIRYNFLVVLVFFVIIDANALFRGNINAYDGVFDLYMASKLLALLYAGLSSFNKNQIVSIDSILLLFSFIITLSFQFYLARYVLQLIRKRNK